MKKIKEDSMTIVEKREKLEADLYDLSQEYKKKEEVIKNELRSLQKSCSHGNVSYNGGGFWCKDCGYTR